MPTFRTAPELTIVTGAGGWLGTALTSKLSGEERRVRALVQLPDDVPRLSSLPGVEIHVGDVTDPATLSKLFAGAAGADVFHAAGVIHPQRVEQFEQINAGGTRAVLAAARDAQVRRLVHVSSNSPFGVNPTPTDTFRAEEPFNPYMGYGRSKMHGEQAARAANGDGLETVVVRPPWFYGPFQPARQTRFFTAVRTGKFPLIGKGENRRSMAYVHNLVDGLLRAELAEGVDGRAYWIADRRPYPMAEILDTVREALRAEGYEVKKNGPRLPGAVGTIAEKADGLLQARGKYIQEIHVLSEMDKTIACDISTAEADLGYDPQVELLEGMRASISWCRAQGIEL